MNIPTAHSTESLERFLSHILSVPVPTVVDRPYLVASGFRSGNDPELRHISRLLGFIDENDMPLQRWSTYKVQGVQVLQAAVYECYKGLFEFFPDASPQTKSDHELAGWFKPPITGETRSAIERAVRTFRKLCQLAGITPENFGRMNAASPHTAGPLPKFHPAAQSKSGPNPPLILNLPSFTNKADYLLLFEALKEIFYE
jgi:hypothetical protein